jgi:hypothetical protein
MEVLSQHLSGDTEKNTVTWLLKSRNNGTRRNYSLLSNGSINAHRSNGYARDNIELLEAVSSTRSVPRPYSEVVGIGSTRTDI